jgi:putative endonuclease
MLGNLLENMPAITPAQTTGNWGETLAFDHLVKMGYRVIERNWRYRKGEIDLIAINGECCVFVEVRTRKDTARVSGYHSIRKDKQELLRQTALAFLRKQPQRRKAFRWDVIEIRHHNQVTHALHHYTNIPWFRVSDRF